MGADAVLLIAAMLDVAQVDELRAQAVDLGMDALVEVHSLDEAENMMKIGCDLIGINNRNLTDFRTDLSITESIAPLIAGRALVVSESALRNCDDIDRVAQAGARAVLIGTTFCAAPDVEAKVAEVMGW